MATTISKPALSFNMMEPSKGLSNGKLKLCEFAKKGMSDEENASQPMAFSDRNFILRLVNKPFEKEHVPLTREDMTQQKKVNQILKSLSVVLNKSFDAIVITDKNGIIEYANSAFCEASGFSLEDILGNTLGILKSGKHSKKFFEEMWKTILSGKVWEGEICNKRKNGDLFWVRQSITPVKDVNGSITHFAGVRLDITQSIEDQENLLKYSHELKRSNSELQQFASIVSHDLHEPLRKVIAFGDLLKEKNKNLDGVSCNYINRMQKATMRMQDLLAGLLSYSRVTTRPNPLEQVDLNRIIEDSLFNLEVRIKRSKGIINVADLPSIQADPSQMVQLFQNLISNALKYHKQGISPVINIQEQYSEIGEIIITIEDNGIGFDEKYIERIFQPFQRLHGKNKYEGTGIGLAICKKIVDRHNGTITVNSSLGEGSTFTVILNTVDKSLTK